MQSNSQLEGGGDKTSATYWQLVALVYITGTNLYVCVSTGMGAGPGIRHGHTTSTSCARQDPEMPVSAPDDVKYVELRARTVDAGRVSSSAKERAAGEHSVDSPPADECGAHLHPR
ncbi:hypothetical protein K439DRAFT_1615316 [Ramaria rubella]|nr:hypothetical protein K439DRAFT_1615316 [Ramaria rubella]